MSGAASPRWTHFGAFRSSLETSLIERHDGSAAGHYGGVTDGTSRQDARHEESGGDEFGHVECLAGPGQGDAGRAGPEIGKRGQRHQRQKVGGNRKRLFWFGLGLAPDVLDRLRQLRKGMGQWARELGKLRPSGILGDEFSNRRREQRQEVLLQYLPPEEVERLYAVRAFVELAYAGIADKLLQPPFPWQLCWITLPQL